MPTAVLAYNPNHISQGLARLITQFKEKPRLSALIAAILNEDQQIEDALWSLLTRALDNPNLSGVSMDAIGKLVGQPRQGQSDGAYLPYIQARIKTNLSDGTVETLLAITVFLVGAGIPILFREYTKAVEIEVDGVTGNAYQIWQQFLNLAKDAGTKLNFIFSNAATSSTLKTTSAYGGSFTTITSQRIDDTYAPGGGGLLAGVIGE